MSELKDGTLVNDIKDLLDEFDYRVKNNRNDLAFVALEQVSDILEKLFEAIK